MQKNERLKSRKRIDELFARGKSFSAFPVRVLYLCEKSGAAPLQAGFSVGVKKIKSAVERNRVKRLMREAYRLSKNNLFEKLCLQSTFLSVFFIYSGTAVPGYYDVSIKIAGALKRLENLIDENPASIS